MNDRPLPAAPTAGRQVGAAMAGAAAAALGALILGEYDFAGATPYVAGLLFGLVVAEVTLTVARHGTRALAATSAVESGLGLAWAGWITSGRGVAPYPATAFAAIAIGVVVAAGWVILPSRRRNAPAGGPPPPGDATT